MIAVLMGTIALHVNSGNAAVSFLEQGHTARLERVMAKARRGEPITVGVIGGSITQGSNASSQRKNYASLVTEWWRKTFPKAEIQLVNAGIGATGSDYGALRVERDLLSHHPDFVIIEYSVNDQNVQASAESMEGVVRQVLRQPNAPAAILLFMMLKGGKNAQEWHGKVGRHYHLPMVSMRDALWPEIEAGREKWDDYYADVVHPNDRGHAFTAKVVTDMLEGVLKHLPPDDQLPSVEKNMPAPMFSTQFEHTLLYEGDALKPVSNDGWTFGEVGRGKGWKADKPGSRIAFEIDGRFILLMHWHVRGPMGKARVQVDDLPAKTIDAWYDQTWGGYRQTDELAHDLPPGKHCVTIEVLPDKNPESTGHAFQILGLGAAGVGQSEAKP